MKNWRKLRFCRRQGKDLLLIAEELQRKVSYRFFICLFVFLFCLFDLFCFCKGHILILLEANKYMISVPGLINQYLNINTLFDVIYLALG